jgi:hypothetical protein
LDNTKTGDKSLAAIAHLENLERLFMSSTKITDVGLMQLEKLPKLKLLVIKDTVVSKEAEENLKKKLPGSSVER